VAEGSWTRPPSLREDHRRCLGARMRRSDFACSRWCVRWSRQDACADQRGRFADDATSCAGIPFGNREVWPLADQVVHYWFGCGDCALCDPCLHARGLVDLHTKSALERVLKQYDLNDSSGIITSRATCMFESFIHGDIIIIHHSLSNSYPAWLTSSVCAAYKYSAP
jgi:hypothetical protein